jgi:hypothetical protein
VWKNTFLGNKKILILKFKGEKKKSTPAQPQTTNHNCHTHQTKKMGERQEFINFAKRCSLEQIRLCFQPKYHKRKMKVGYKIYIWLCHSNGSKSPFKVQNNSERVEIQEGEGRSLGGAFKNVANTTP